MLAAVFKGSGQLLAIEDVKDPTPGEEEVILKVAACGICGTDLHMTSGKGALKAPAGHILGHEFAGEVVAVGAGCRQIRVGDRITSAPTVGCGRCAACLSGEPKMVCETAINARWIWPIPCNRRAFLQQTTSWSFVGRRGACGAIGRGPARSRGRETVPWRTGTDTRSRPHRACRRILGHARRRGAHRGCLALALRMGASSFVSTDLGPDAADILQASRGGPAHVAFECVGVPGMIEKAVTFQRPMGTVIVPGCCDTPDTWLPMQALFKEVRPLFGSLYGLRDCTRALKPLKLDMSRPGR